MYLDKKLQKAIAKRALELLEGGWTYGAAARDKYGHPVWPQHPSACRFCASGAITRACHEAGMSSWASSMQVVQFVTKFLPKGLGNLVSVNDRGLLRDHSHKESKALVLATFRKAAA